MGRLNHDKIVILAVNDYKMDGLVLLEFLDTYRSSYNGQLYICKTYMYSAINLISLQGFISNMFPKSETLYFKLDNSFCIRLAHKCVKTVYIYHGNHNKHKRRQG